MHDEAGEIKIWKLGGSFAVGGVPDVRFFSRDTKGWKWVVDNRMRDYGETDYERQIVRINRAFTESIASVFSIRSCTKNSTCSTPS